MVTSARRISEKPKENHYKDILMLPYTFCGMGGIGPEAERRLWNNGILTWNDYRREGAFFFSSEKHRIILEDLQQAEYYFRQGDRGLKWFLKKLPLSHHCRLRPHILDRCLYLDIETTGLDTNDLVTVITISDGKNRQSYARDDDFIKCKEKFLSLKKVYFVTFNGRSFDVPRLRKTLALPLRQTNLDLQPILKACGYTGGQKKIEKILGVRRSAETASFTGMDAVQMWRDYQNGDEAALGLLIKYNLEDVIGLEKIFELIYIESMKGFPWSLF